LSGGSDVPNHSFLADLQTMSFTVQVAAVHTCKHHFSACFIVQVDAGFEAAKRRPGNFLHDAVDELVEIEDGGDFLRSLLQALQVGYDFIAEDARRNFCRCQIRKGRHGSPIVFC
jgi:hypothetical protein